MASFRTVLILTAKAQVCPVRTLARSEYSDPELAVLEIPILGNGQDLDVPQTFLCNLVLPARVQVALTRSVCNK